MRTSDLEKLTKKELLEMLEKTRDKLSAIKQENPKSKEIPTLETKIKKIKRVLYECLFCADAQVTTRLDKDGNEKDFIKKDCGLDKCPYHDYFANKTKEDDARIKNLLKLFFKNA